MNRREFLKAAGAGAVLAALPRWARAQASAPAGGERPNILLVLSDDHSAPHLGCYGNADIKTPNLDRFASRGMRFDRAYVACPQCVPSRASIMTGRSPVAIQMTRFTAPLPAEVRTYPELLRHAGYFTGVAGRTYHLDGASGYPAEVEAVFKENGLRTFRDRLDFVKTARPDGVLAQFREFLDQVPEDASAKSGRKPFFLQLCFFDPHRVLDRNAIPVPHDPARLTLPRHYPDTPAVRDDFARYYDEIARMDGDFGQVMAELDKRGLADNTLVAFMGDNGASQLRGKGTLYEFGIHVPLLVRWPGMTREGTACADLISGEDLAPTFLAAAGLTAPKEMTGQSFLAQSLGRPAAGRKYVFAERGAHGSGLPTNSAFFDLGRCVVSRTHKLIYNATSQLPYMPVDFGGDGFWKEIVQMHQAGKLDPDLAKLYFPEKRPVFELYCLQDDPWEMTNLYGRPEAAAVQQELLVAMDRWMILERDFLPLPLAPARKSPAKAKASSRPAAEQ